MKTIRDIEHLDGVKVLVRCDFNVPVRNGKVVDDFRLRIALPTIKYLYEKGAKVILISHLETNEGDAASLKPVADHFNSLGTPVIFIDNYRNTHQIVETFVEGACIVLLENLRTLAGEKNNDDKFAAELASLADIYVNEAFPVSHREHASIVSVPRHLPSYAGFHFEKEVENLSKTFNPARPFVFILNGAKFETKIPLLNKFLNIADTVFVGGALATDFFKQKGYEVGNSLVSKSEINLAEASRNPKLLLPVDVMDEDKKIWLPEGFPPGKRIVDFGPKTLEILEEHLSDAKFVLWNGPTGIYEEGFNQMTEDLARFVAARTEKGLISVVGGGDTVAALQKLNLIDKLTFVSSGGGAMLDFLAKGTLPGIEALNQAQG